MPTSRKRSVQIKVTLTPELHAKLAEVAKEFGQAPATLCSVWIGQAVAQQARNLAAGEKVGQQLVAAVAPEAVQQMRLAMGEKA
jgi:hypothetical protein